MGRLSKYKPFVKKMQSGLEASLFYKLEDFMMDFMCSNDFLEVVEGLIKEGEYDDAVYNRVKDSDDLTNAFCGGCKNKCTVVCRGYHLRG